MKRVRTWQPVMYRLRIDGRYAYVTATGPMFEWHLPWRAKQNHGTEPSLGEAMISAERAARKGKR